jgi:hypothetical protein
LRRCFTVTHRQPSFCKIFAIRSGFEIARPVDIDK